MREALWGKPGGFDATHPLYQAIEAIAAVRASRPAIRYGRQYFRPIAGDRQHFAISSFAPGVLAISRILNDDEVVVIGNAAFDSTATISIIVDAALHVPGDGFGVLYSNKLQANPPDPVEELTSVRVDEVDGSTGFGPLRAIRVNLQPGEVQILGR